MNKVKRKINVTCKVAMLIMGLAILGICLSACGDNNQPPRQMVYVQQPVAPPQPLYNWSATSDGFIRYRWMNDGSCVVVVAGSQFILPRTQRTGNLGMVSWKWENDGDVDIKTNGRKYDLDSPFDPDDNGEAFGYDADGYDADGYGYDDFGTKYAAGGALAGGVGAYHLMSRKKAKVFGYDAHGNPLDKKGRIISPYDKNGKHIRLVDTKGNPLPNNGQLSKTWGKAPAPVPGTTAVGTATPVGGKTSAQLAAENRALQDKLARQKAELKRQQEANRKNNLRLKKAAYQKGIHHGVQNNS